MGSYIKRNKNEQIKGMILN